jgi:flagellar hook-associated protein 2
VGSPVTLSGYNSIDFSVVLNAIMTQERVPVTLLEKQQTSLTAQKSAFSALAAKLSSLQSAADDLAGTNAFDSTSATVSDPTRVSFSSGSSAARGTYQITVNRLALAQVSLSNGLDDKDTAIVATGGTFSLGADRTVDISGPVTLEGLASAINDADVGVSASIVRNAAGYHLMLTGQNSGAGNTFTPSAEALTGGTAALSFSTSQTAQDAEITLNGVTVTSSTNTFDSAIAGASFTVLRQDLANPVVVTITASSESLKALVQKIVAAFNDTVKFLDEQHAAAAKGETNNIGRDTLVRSLRREMTSALIAENTAGGGSFTALAQIGFSLSRTGQLTLDEATFEEALRSNRGDVQKLFFGSDGSNGVFGRFESAIGQFTQVGGLLSNTQQRLTEQASRIATRIAEMEERLATRRAALQQQFIAADLAMAQLKAQGSQLSSVGSSLF